MLGIVRLTLTLGLGPIVLQVCCVGVSNSSTNCFDARCECRTRESGTTMPKTEAQTGCRPRHPAVKETTLANVSRVYSGSLDNT